MKFGAKLIFEIFVITWLMTLTNCEVTSLLRIEVSWAVALSTHGRISSKAVWAVGFSTHSFIDTQVSEVTLIQHKQEVKHYKSKTVIQIVRPHQLGEITKINQFWEVPNYESSKVQWRRNYKRSEIVLLIIPKKNNFAC